MLSLMMWKISFRNMLNVIIIMKIGIIIGVVLHKHKRFIEIVEGLITYAIWVLLFLLGLSIGSNELIIKNIGTLGLKAIILSFSATAGSVILSYFLYIFLFKHER